MLGYVSRNYSACGGPIGRIIKKRLDYAAALPVSMPIIGPCETHAYSECLRVSSSEKGKKINIVSQYKDRRDTGVKTAMLCVSRGSRVGGPPPNKSRGYTLEIA